jgi:hypothetical protein
VWNAGEPPVEGYTNFLWVIFNSFGLLIGLQPEFVSRLIGILSGIIAIVYIYFAGKKFAGFNPTVSLLPCLLLAVSGPYATWASSGMETNLFTLLLFAGLYHNIKYQFVQKINSVIYSFIFLLLATLTRPEGFGIFLILFFITFLVGIRTEKTHRIRPVLLAALFFYLIPFTIYFIWRATYFGYLLPNTYYAKTGGGFNQIIRGLKYFYFFGLHFLLPLVPLIAFFLFTDLKKSKKFINEISGDEKKSYTLLIFFCVFVIYTLYIIYVGGDYMAMYRFFVPVLPLIYLITAYVFNYLIKNFPDNGRKKRFAFILLIIFFTGTLIQSTPLDTVLFHKPAITHGQYHGVQFEKWNSNRLTVIGKFFNEYKKSSDESLATDAIGAVSYYSNLKVYDIHGIVNPVIAHQKSDKVGKGFPGHEKVDLEYILSKMPTYFMFRREFSKQPTGFSKTDAKNIGLEMYPYPAFEKDYELKSIWLRDELNKEEGYFTFYQRIVQE